jgi:ADP-heptose:LPS heptosyltransferase
MFRNNSIKIVEHLNVVFDNGGMGDHVASMSTVKYMHNHAPNIIQHVWVPDYFLDLAKNLVPGVIIKPFSKQKDYNVKFGTLKLSCQQHSSMGVHLVDFAFNVLVDKQVDIEHKNYCKLNVDTIDVSKFNLPEKYVVLTTGFTAKVREMLPSIANDLISYIKSKGYEVVTLGSYIAKVGAGNNNIEGNFKEDIKYSECFDLINKTNLLEAGKIISQAKAIVGLDNGLLHLAGTTEIPIVMGFTTVLPEHRMPYRHNQLGWNCYPVTPNESLGCGGCQSRMVHVYDHDFRNCYYGDYACLPQVSSEKYINQLEKIL